MFSSQEKLRFSSMTVDSEDVYKKTGWGRWQYLILFVCSLLFFGVGIGIGYGIGRNQSEQTIPQAGVTAPETATDPPRSSNPVETILSHINKENIKQNLRKYTSRPRMSGTPGGDELVQILHDTWKSYGIDEVKVTPYDVLMSYPNKTNPNRVQLLTLSNELVFQSALFEPALDDLSNNSEIIPPFNAFAAAGISEGELVYVNYGRIKDFLYLINNKSMDLKGKTMIARYGKIFRGDKVKNAQRFNASGIIMYTDPFDFNRGNSTYPDSWWMPPSGLQRGTVGPDGDQLTPLYPATDYAYRKEQSDTENFRIPAQPISYGDALPLLREMAGEEVPPDWRGALPISYRLGPGFRNSSLKIRVEVNNFEERRIVENVIGYIKGQTEPDRYILLGNHHDAWVFGAIDPLSGTAVLTELIRVFGEMLKSGTRPDRTIVFCAWGAEEHGLIGSTEWVEEYMKVLYERAVAYLNVDYAVDYSYVLTAGTSPLLQDSLYEATKLVPNPESNSPDKTVYDAWKTRDGSNDVEPSVYYSLGSGSDMATFYQRAGVPSVDMWFTYDSDKWDILSYPVYHSAYETIYLYEKFIDPDFSYTKSMAGLWGILAWNIANDKVLKYDVRRYASAINTFITSLKKDFGVKWSKENVNIAALESAAQNLTTEANRFHLKLQQKLHHKNKISVLESRMINDRLIQFERAFIDCEGLPGRPMYKHVMFAPSMYDSYSDNSFPGIVDTMNEIEHRNATEKWGILKQQVYVATFTIQSAANTLTEIGL
ncbi:N-acetylated-alpha-linked acidic dipeptidase 2-like isoform X2 [Saccostrea echinata]|uniref:N-acetylated-alpha-linked acidic dipeptidase 2-like isoform X2 n=1 Tax=Saccostrea echinata TaxID=191078 RepID=UPI002A7F1C6F|nr:N-acetylated-alpha-linked acidic dipeptidase 2-like isoform X2 [Saccostrea echinata]